MTTAIHWLRGVSFDKPLQDVLTALAGTLDESVVVLGYGSNGYSDGYLVGQVKVYAHPDRPDMGVMVEVDGDACETLGGAALASLAVDLDLRCSRLDLAVDGCPFEPATLRDAWQAGDVRSRSKIPAEARPDRQWRTSRWEEDPTGDVFRMGSRTSTQYARCYDRRGFTRFELELKREAAQLASVELWAMLLADPELVPVTVLAWVRRFVDFVDTSSSSHASRRELLPFWAEFVQGVQAASVVLSGKVVRTLEQVQSWMENQVAPSLALVVEAFGMANLVRLAHAGRERWTARHRAMLGGRSRLAM